MTEKTEDLIVKAREAARDKSRRSKRLLNKLASALEAATEQFEKAEQERDEFKRLFSECHPVHLDGVRRAEAAEATLERVRALHRVDQYTEGRAVVRCVCEETWPCSTIQALDGKEKNE